jgi:hypothetical protein
MLLLVPLVTISGVALVSGSPANGSFTFTVNGYTVTGQLTDATIEHGGTVQMLMSIDQTVSTSYGAAHITGSGVWSGETNFQNVNGAIGNLSGTVQVCAVFYCQNADFTGSGTWGGTLSWSSGAESQGSGTFQGTLNFSGSQITQNGPVPVSGNWTAYFET